MEHTCCITECYYRKQNIANLPPYCCFAINCTWKITQKKIDWSMNDWVKAKCTMMKSLVKILSHIIVCHSTLKLKPYFMTFYIFSILRLLWRLTKLLFVDFHDLTTWLLITRGDPSYPCTDKESSLYLQVVQQLLHIDQLHGCNPS